jgi:hypothetical protein
MGLDRDIKKLVPEMAEKVERFLYELNKAGIRAMVNEARRTRDVQIAYYAQGRESFEKINELRKKAGLWAIGPLQADKVITWTLQSKHIEGKAVDIVPLAPDGKAWWDAPPKVWEGIGIIGETCGLKWGGRWKVKDLPHFEID